MDLTVMERIKEKCIESECCKCELYNVCPNYSAPSLWKIEAIRKVLEEIGDKESDKEEIVVPEKLEAVYEALGEDKEEEIVVPKKNGNNYINALKGTVYNNVLIKQNEIIDCLEQIKEKLK